MFKFLVFPFCMRLQVWNVVLGSFSLDSCWSYLFLLLLLLSSCLWRVRFDVWLNLLALEFLFISFDAEGLPSRDFMTLIDVLKKSFWIQCPGIDPIPRTYKSGLNETWSFPFSEWNMELPFFWMKHGAFLFLRQFHKIKRFFHQDFLSQTQTIHGTAGKMTG